MFGASSKVCLIFLLLLFFSALFNPSSSQENPYKDLIAGAGVSEDYDGADMVVVFDSTDVVVEASGLSHINIHRLTKVLTEAGASELSGLRFDYDPASNMVQIQKVAVYRLDGKVEEIDPAGALDRPQPQHMIYWGTRMKVVGVPDLKVGEAVEVKYYTKGFMIAYLEGTEDESRYIPPMRGHYYDTILFGSGIPIKEKVYVLKTGADKPVQFEVYNGDIQTTCLTGLEGRDGYTYIFKKQNIPVYPGEIASPDGQDYIPKVVLATVKDWKEKSRWFYNVNENSVIDIYGMKVKPFEFNNEIKEFTQKLIAPYKTDIEKRKAILMWVALHIRYSGISMGKGEGYTLHPGIMTFRDRCGVCKDIAGMSITMLRAAGYTVYPTMTMAGARVERIPADQFNHCVAAVDISREGIKSDALGGRAGFEDKYDMYDATWAPNSMEVWSRYEGDQNIVIGSPEGENLTAIRPFKPEENRLNIISKATINKDGDLTGTFELVGVGGGPDTRLRRFFAYTGNKDEIWQALSNYLSKLAPGTELIGYEYSDLGDFWNPLKVRIDYRTPGYAQIYGEGLHFTSPAAEFMPATGFLRTIFRYATLEERKNPLFLYAPQDVAITEEIAVPSGYKRLSEIKPVEAGADFANFKASVEKSKIGVKLTYHYTVAERYVETSEYPQVWDITQQMKNFADQNIHIWRN